MSEKKEEEEEEEEEDDYPAVVIDLGSGYTKCGYAGDDYPKSIFPTVVGHPKSQGTMIGMTQRAEYAGSEAMNRRGILNIEYPIKHGIVEDWDEIENVMQYAYYSELRVPPEDYHTLLTDAPGNPKSNREKMVEMVFETLNSVSFFVSITSTLALYASGRTSGIVLDSGHGLTTSVPIFEGMPMPHGIKRLNVGGGELTEWLTRQLRYRGFAFESSSDRDIVREIKEKNCYCSLDFKADNEKFNNNDGEITKSYKLPDGNIVNIGAERFQIVECLFNPMLMGLEAPGMGQLVYDTIQNCDIDVRRTLYRNVVCAGGNTMFRGLEPRLEAEIQRITPSKAIVDVIIPKDRKLSTWLGGSVLASLSTFKDLWVMAFEYEEEGPRVIDRFG